MSETDPALNGDGTAQRAAGATRPGPILPLSRDAGTEAALASLGRALYHDPQLSGSGNHSCATCHNVDLGGADGQQFAVGADGTRTPVNSPTIFNAAQAFRFYWDGRASRLEDCLEEEFIARNRMAADWNQAAAAVASNEAYRPLLEAAGIETVSREVFLRAIAAYIAGLTTPNAPFDRWLNGEADAISSAAKRGYEQFQQYGCVRCHQGALLGANMFASFGAYFAGRPGAAAGEYLGRATSTGSEVDRYVFRVPSLRNVALTAPYLHDGTAQTLAEAVAIMAETQAQTAVTDQDRDDIVAFLQTLTGEYEGKTLENRAP